MDRIINQLSKKLLLVGTKKDVYNMIAVLIRMEVNWDKYYVLKGNMSTIGIEKICDEILKEVNNTTHIVLMLDSEDACKIQKELGCDVVALLNYSVAKILSSIRAIRKCYGILSDEMSKRVLCAAIRAKLNKEVFIFNNVYTDEKQYVGQIKKLIKCENIIDAGAYDGDTVKDIITSDIMYDKIYALEPDSMNYEKLKKTIESLDVKGKVIPINVGVGFLENDVCFKSDGKYSKIDRESKGIVKITAIDRLGIQHVSVIKMDIEGYEKEAILGAINTIKRDKPLLCICVYHNIEDIWQIPLLIQILCKEYKIILRHHRQNSSYESVCYAFT